MASHGCFVQSSWQKRMLEQTKYRKEESVKIIQKSKREISPSSSDPDLATVGNAPEYPPFKEFSE